MEYRDGREYAAHPLDEVYQMADWLMQMNQGDTPRPQQRPDAPVYSRQKARTDAAQLLSNLEQASLDAPFAEEFETPSE